MNSFQTDGWHTVTPRIITSQPEEMIRFVKEVFGGQGEFHVNRPAEIRIGDSIIMISDGGGLRDCMSLGCIWSARTMSVVEVSVVWALQIQRLEGSRRRWRHLCHLNG